MGLFKSIKKTVRRVENFAHRAAGKPEIGTRGEAADQLLGGPQKRNVNVSRQAGSGQIKYTGEEIS